jgi:hypothetical protein
MKTYYVSATHMPWLGTNSADYCIIFLVSLVVKGSSEGVGLID